MLDTTQVVSLLQAAEPAGSSDFSWCVFLILSIMRLRTKKLGLDYANVAQLQPPRSILCSSSCILTELFYFVSGMQAG